MGDERPDAAPPPEGASIRRALIIVAVALTIVAAGVGFGVGRLTAPSAGTEAASPSATTTTVIIETVGETLDWSESADVGELWPVGIVEHDGMVFFFGSPAVQFGPTVPEGSGLEAWVSDDGSGWESLGTVIPAPALVQDVVSTPQGLIAVGTGAEGVPIVWQSPDARQWSESPLPTDEASLPGTQTSLSAAGGNDEVAVVFGNTGFNEQQMILDAIGEDLGSFGMSYGGPRGPFTVFGPLGIAVFSATADELDLTDEQLSLLFEESGEEGSTVWSSFDGVSWITSEIEANYISSVSTNEDGELVALGSGHYGMEAWTSTDGVEWTSQGSVGEVGEVEQITAWNDGFVAIRFLGPSGEILYSEDGEDWETLGVEALLSQELFWSYYPLSAGSAGIAAVAHGYDESMDFGFAGPEPIVLERDGYTLTVDQERGSLIVAEGDTELLRLFLDSERVPEEVITDLEAKTMTFLDPDTGEALATFTFDELEEAEQASFEGMEGGRDRQVFLFSTDGSGWSVQDLSEVAGEGSSVEGLQVMEDRVVATVTEFSESFAGPPSLPRVMIWTGLVP